MTKTVTYDWENPPSNIFGVPEYTEDWCQFKAGEPTKYYEQFPLSKRIMQFFSDTVTDLLIKYTSIHSK